MYSRTQNEDGSYNSRCLYCFMTIAAAVAEEQALDPIEKRHICPERALSELFRMEQERATQARAS